MAHPQSNSKNNSVKSNGEGEVKPTTFHDFLGHKNKAHESVPISGGRPPSDVMPPSDLGSERHAGNHLEGIPFYGSRGDINGPESSKRFSGFKRSNSDSFMLSSKDKFPPGQADSQDSPLLTKLLRYSGAERRPIDEDTYITQTRPIPASFVSQSSAALRTDTNSPKWDRVATQVNPGPVLQYPPRAGQVMQFGYPTSSNRFKETAVGTSVISQTAADEGSRTGIKGSGILSSMHGTPVRQPSGVLIRTGNKQKSSISEPEPSTVPSQSGTEAGGRQMTIFYGGQAHVFDNVHPNKADVIMALAGSNGGSWCTNFTPNSGSRPTTGENHIPNTGENAVAMLRELHGRPTDKGEPLRGFRTGNFEGGIRIKENMPPGRGKMSSAEKPDDES